LPSDLVGVLAVADRGGRAHPQTDHQCNGRFRNNKQVAALGARSGIRKKMPNDDDVLNGGQVIVDLIRDRMPYVFGLCGHGNIQFIDTLYERSSDHKTISVPHEIVAGFMADVYFRVQENRLRP
jgi:Thiamine pyrophosphate enzyme, N-terminal TPP binding domain